MVDCVCADWCVPVRGVPYGECVWCVVCVRFKHCAVCGVSGVSARGVGMVKCVCAGWCVCL